MIPKEEFALRMERVQRKAAERGLDCILAFSRFYDRPAFVQYLCNHYPPFPTAVAAPSFRGIGYSALVLPTNGEGTLVSDSWYYRKDKVTVEDVAYNPDVSAETIRVLKDKGLDKGRIGVAGGDIFPYVLYEEIRTSLPKAELIPADDILLKIQRKKSENELKLMRECARIVDVAMEEALKLMKPGITEWEVCSAAVGKAIREGSENVRLRVQSGTWSSMPVRWPPATNKVLEKQDIVVMDCVGTFQDYSYDITRTAVVGKPTDYQRELLEIQYNATMYLINNIKPGMTSNEVGMLAEDYYAKTPVAKKRRPGNMVGHDIGIEPGGTFVLRLGNENVVESGGALCIEPGLYLPDEGLGVRVEEMVILSETGCEKINKVNPTPWR